MTTIIDEENQLKKYKESQKKLFESEGVSPVSKFVTLDEVVSKVHYLEVGQGKPLILIHGGGGDTNQWINMIKHLQSNFRLLIVDRPGSGLTDSFNYRGVDFKDHCTLFIKSFMEALNIPNADFAANSMGGYWIALFAMKHPEKVNKIIFLGAPAGLDSRLPFFLRLLGVRGINNFLWSTIAKPSLKGTKKLYEMLLVADIGNLSQEYIECGYYSSILPSYKTAWLTLLENISTMKGFRKNYYIGDKMNKISNSVLFLWGDQDAFQSAAEGEKISRKMKMSEFIQVHNAGHLPWLDQPEFCTNKIIRFLS